MMRQNQDFYTVYPRWRGELFPPCGKRVRFRGLSPLARGTLINLVYIGLRGRFIPAGAGNSRSQSCSICPVSVYPRWRGELQITNFRKSLGNGLSPLARGTHRGIQFRCGIVRFIPAGAGNSPVRAGSNPAQTVYPRWRGELTKHNLLLIIDFLSQSQSTNFIVSHKQHIHYVKEHLIH